MAERPGARLAGPLRQSIDWGQLAPLKLRARLVADGLFAGAHRSIRRGAGVEFAGHRVYVPGDELRFIDVRASLRQERIVVRHFETETERALRLVVDATASMGFAGERVAVSKLGYASVIAAALCRVALAGGDPVGLDFVGGAGSATRVTPSASSEVFSRVVGSLEALRASGDARAERQVLEEGLALTLRGARRGSAIVVLSDLVDLPDGGIEAIAALGTRGQVLVVVQVLTPEEVEFPFDGPVRLRASESGPRDARFVQTDGPSVREAYRKALAEQTAQQRDAVTRHGGALVRVTTDEDPVLAGRRILLALSGAVVEDERGERAR
jgi:uncharacterized protein (DUF58 family)